METTEWLTEINSYFLVISQSSQIITSFSLIREFFESKYILSTKHRGNKLKLKEKPIEAGTYPAPLKLMGVSLTSVDGRLYFCF